MDFEWRAVAGERPGDPEDPWSTWFVARPTTNRFYWALCERTSDQTPESFAARSPTAQIPAIYRRLGAAATFFTVRTPIETVRQGDATQPELGALGPVAAACPGVDGLPAPDTPVLDAVRHAAEAVVRACGAMASAVRRLLGARQVDFASPGILAKGPVIGIIDERIAFLHRQFRRDAPGGARSRILSFWDQSFEARSPVLSPWRMPEEFTYGRELARPEIDAILNGAHRQTDARMYGQLGLVAPDWGHGTQVLSLAAGRGDPLQGLATPDAAAEADIIAVQLPDEAVRQTHGIWLNVFVLDALHYILSKAPGDVPVVVNVSLGSYSGGHDGRGLLDRAIADLIELHRGRLTVVVPTGNGRDVAAHARLDLAPGAVGTLKVNMPADDDTPNFVELFCTAPGAAGRGSVVCSMQVASVPQKAVVPLDGSDAHALVRSTLTPPQSVAMLLSANGPSPVPARPQGKCFIGIAPPRSRFGRAVGAAPAGDWTIDVNNGAEHAVVVNAWLARDESLRGNGPQRRGKQFEPATVASVDGTMTSLAWVPGVIAVGGYVLDDAGGKATGMYAASGAGFALAAAESLERRRLGPDLCAPAKTKSGMRPLPFLSEKTSCNDPTPVEGTSLAAGVATRRIVNLLAEQSEAVLNRDALLQALKARHANAMPASVNVEPAWTSDYWLPV